MCVSGLGDIPIKAEAPRKVQKGKESKGVHKKECENSYTEDVECLWIEPNNERKVT